MRKIKRLICPIIVTLIIGMPMSAQELRCHINIVYDKIQTSERQYFEKLQTAMYEFVNNKAWTNHVYSYEERIECAMLFNLEQQISQNEFKGTLQIQSSRPVFNSTYNTVLFNFKDNDIQFTYLENEPIEFSLTSFTSNLSSILAYYVYVILGLDYDSYSLEGGTEFFQKAETVVLNAQSAKEKGWKAFESSDHKNRYWFIKNMLDDKFRPLREFSYNYHRQGLDLMADKVNESRADMAKNIELLQRLYRARPDPFMYVLNVLFDAKSQEFIDIFSESPMDEKNRVIQMLSEMDPANSGKYKQMRQQ